MKCPACWAEKAYKRKTKGLQRVLYTCFLLTPLKCHHCYHKFVVPQFLTLGKKVFAPVQTSGSGLSKKKSCATKYLASQQINNSQDESFQQPVRKAA